MLDLDVDPDLFLPHNPDRGNQTWAFDESGREGSAKISPRC